MESQSGCRHDGSLGKDSETLRKFRNLPYHLGVYSGAPGDFEEELQYFASQVESAAGGLIDAAIFQLELQADPGETEETEAAAATHTVATGPIFVVHGRDDGRKLMRLLDRTAIESHPVVLHEQPNGGATILEKFERHAQRASCAVVLLTGDDEGHLRRHDGPLSPPGRQNVILELGVFIGLLGRAHVAVLMDPDVEPPSDLNGIVYIPLDKAGAWRYELLKELAAMGIKVDPARIP